VRGQGTSTTHIDPDGHTWHVTVHWADIGGRSTPIGVDLRAFTGNDDQVRPTGGVLTAAVVRSLRIAEIIEDTRKQAPRARPARTPGGEQAGRNTPTKRCAGRPPERDDGFVAEVAALYHEAKAQGGEPARKPWRYVANRLAAQGIPDVTDGQLKNWSRRAKNLGLLDTTRPTRKEKK
jgi:hypothetical protein